MFFQRPTCGTNQKCFYGFALISLTGWLLVIVNGSTNVSSNPNIHYPIADTIQSPLADPLNPKPGQGNHLALPQEDETITRVRPEERLPGVIVAVSSENRPDQVTEITFPERPLVGSTERIILEKLEESVQGASTENLPSTSEEPQTNESQSTERLLGPRSLESNPGESSENLSSRSESSVRILDESSEHFPRLTGSTERLPDDPNLSGHFQSIERLPVESGSTSTSNPLTSNGGSRDQLARRLNYKRAKIGIATTTPTTITTETTNHDVTSSARNLARIDHQESGHEAAHGGDFGEVLQLDRPPSSSQTSSSTSPLFAKRLITSQFTSGQQLEIPHSLAQDQPVAGHHQSESFDVEYAHHQPGTESYWEASRMPPTAATDSVPSTTFATTTNGATSRPRFRTSLRRSNASFVRSSTTTTERAPAIVDFEWQAADTATGEVDHNIQRRPDSNVEVRSNGSGTDSDGSDNNVVFPLQLPASVSTINRTENVGAASGGSPSKPDPADETNTINFRDEVHRHRPASVNTSSANQMASAGDGSPMLDNGLDLLPSLLPSTALVHSNFGNRTDNTLIQASAEFGAKVLPLTTSSITFELEQLQSDVLLYRPTPLPSPMMTNSTDTNIESQTSTSFVQASIFDAITPTSTSGGGGVIAAQLSTSEMTSEGDWTNVLPAPETMPNHDPDFTGSILDSVTFSSGDPWTPIQMSTLVMANNSDSGHQHIPSLVVAKDAEPIVSSVTTGAPKMDGRIFLLNESSQIHIQINTETVLLNLFSPAVTAPSVSMTETSTRNGGESNATKISETIPLINENPPDGVTPKSESNKTRTTTGSEMEIVPSRVISLKPYTGDTKPETFTEDVALVSDKTVKNESLATLQTNQTWFAVQTSSPTVPAQDLQSATLYPSLGSYLETIEMDTVSPNWVISSVSGSLGEELFSSQPFDDTFNETELIATVQTENSLETVILTQPDTNNDVSTETGPISSTLVISPSSSTEIGISKHANMPKDKSPTSPIVIKTDYTMPTIKVPLVYLMITMKCTWAYFCLHRKDIQLEFSDHLSHAMTMKIFDYQIVFFHINACNLVTLDSENDVNHNFQSMINVSLYVSDKSGSYSVSLTELLGDLILRHPHKGFGNNVTLHDLVVAVQLHRNDNRVLGNSPPEESDMGIIAAITISSIAATCLVLLCILLIVLKRRQGAKQQRTRRCRPVTDAYSLDSISIYSSFCKRKLRASKRSYLNQGFEDSQAPSNKINFAGLANFSLDENALNEEYKQIPMTMAKLGELPQGTEIKNRYANVIPFPETRVLLTAKPDDPCSDYINANYVRGFRGLSKSYIACQAPLEHTVVDFWQMVWENQCKVVIMLTNLEEDGVSKCATYFAESDTIDSHRLFGDYQVTTKKKDKRDTYVVNYIQLTNLEKNLMREVVHFWYTAWPTHSTPQDHVSVAEMLVEARPSIKNNQGPTVVHCSTGTGRTGAVIAINICIQEFETSRTVDIPKVVYRLRQDRGGLVQTPEQYIFIYQVLNEFASKIMNHSERSSLRSSK